MNNNQYIYTNGQVKGPLSQDVVKKRKPRPKHWLFSLYWWNPLIYVFIIISLFYCLIKGALSGLKEWKAETNKLIKDYNWK